MVAEIKMPGVYIKRDLDGIEISGAVVN